MMLKKYLLMPIGLLLTLASLSSHAVPTVIQDEYWGAAPTRNSYSNRDVIGNPNYFDIDRMEVDFNGGFMDVTIYTNYIDGVYGTNYGDLFISTNGWNPDTSASNYANDNALTGEDWEFVYDNDEGLVGGDFGILLSNDFLNENSQIFRGGQEVRRDPNGGGTLFNDGSSVDFSNAGYNGSISYRIDMASLGFFGSSTDIGLHWNMTCGNDTIEGIAHYDVPEPAALSMLALGLLGLTMRRRKKT